MFPLWSEALHQTETAITRETEMHKNDQRKQNKKNTTTTRKQQETNQEKSYTLTKIDLFLLLLFLLPCFFCFFSRVLCRTLFPTMGLLPRKRVQAERARFESSDSNKLASSGSRKVRACCVLNCCTYYKYNIVLLKVLLISYQAHYCTVVRSARKACCRARAEGRIQQKLTAQASLSSSSSSWDTKCFCIHRV